MKEKRKKLYQLEIMSQKDIIQYVVDNSDVLDGKDMTKVKQVEEDIDGQLLVLMEDGNLYINKTFLRENIDRIVFLDAIFIFAITRENEVICLTNANSRISKHLCNNGYKYKKIVDTPLVLACLTEDGNIRAINNGLNVSFYSENFQNVVDISVIDDNKDVIVYHGTGKEWQQLYISDL